jgi:trans-2,3-dihydro-3-hydroxyanthranilate isomerase
VLFAVGALRSDADETTIVLEEAIGDVPVRVQFGAAGATAWGGVEPTYAELSVAQLPLEWEAPSPTRLAAALSLDPGALLDGDWAPRVGSCGLPFTLVAVRTRDDVARARVHADAWAAAFPTSDWGAWALGGADGVRDGRRRRARRGAHAAGGPDVHARVFVPELAVPEDPATGSANAALGGFLAARTPRLDGTLRWTVGEGIEMGRPSRLAVSADKGGRRVTAVRVGGRSVVVCEGRDAPPARRRVSDDLKSAGVRRRPHAGPRRSVMAGERLPGSPSRSTHAWWCATAHAPARRGRCCCSSPSPPSRATRCSSTARARAVVKVAQGALQGLA